MVSAGKYDSRRGDLATASLARQSLASRVRVGQPGPYNWKVPATWLLAAGVFVLKLVHAVLVLTILAGAWFAVRSGREQSALRAKHRQLQGATGLIHVTDPTKVHFVAVPTGEPLHFCWQMYVPAGLRQRWTFNADGSSSTSASGASEAYYDLVRVRLRKREDGSWLFWNKTRHGSSSIAYHPKQSAEFENSADLQVQQTGDSDVDVVDHQRVVTLLRLSTAADKPLVEVRFGTPEAFQQQSNQSQRP
jgi:hypothetical protein